MAVLSTTSVLPSSLVIFGASWYLGFAKAMLFPVSSDGGVSIIRLVRNVGFSNTPTTVCVLSRPLSMLCFNVPAVLFSFIL